MRTLAILALIAAFGAARAEIIRADTPVEGIAREIGYLAAGDGTPLAYVVYRRDTAAPARRPTVVWFDVYGAGSMPAVGLVRHWVDHGYAFVGASVRGTGCSQGDYVPFTRQEALDGAAVVEWAGSQPWSSGKVGLIGNSQPGIIQFGIAAQRPQHLAAIAPGGTIRRIYADGWYMGGIYNAAFAEHWSRVDQPQASRDGATRRIELGDTACKATAEQIGPNPLVARITAHPFDGELYRQISPYDRAPEVTVPTLMVQSWTDPAVGSSALDVFRRLTVEHRRLFVLSGGHEAYLYSTAQDEVLRWMDRWLKGEPPGEDTPARVRLDLGTHVRGESAEGDIMPASAPQTTPLRDWPPPETTWHRYSLTADGRLAEREPEDAHSGPRSYFYPSGTELAGSQAQFALTPLVWGSLTYRSPAVAEDTAIVGSPQLSFHAASERTDTDFMVNLHDVSPDGEITFVQRAYLRASHRAVDVQSSTDQYAFHPHRVAEPLVPGTIYQFRLSIPPVAHVLRKGHSLEILIAAPSPIPSPGWGLMPLMLPGFNTLFHDTAHPSQLHIPVMPGVRAQMPKPRCGALMFQPCRIERNTP